MKNLSSRLNNKIELWCEEKVKTDIGNTVEKKLIKKVWADIAPNNSSRSVANGPGDTKITNTKLKARIRKTDISTSNYIVFQSKRYEIEYVLPDFNKNAFMDIFLKLSTD